MKSANEKPSVPDAGPAKEHLLRLYRTMLLIRTVEERLAKSHQRGPDPRRLPHLRRRGGDRGGRVRASASRTMPCSARIAATATRWPRGSSRANSSPSSTAAQTGCSRGRGGSMHLFAPEIGMMGTSGIVGPCILQAAGAGYSFQAAEDRPGGGGLLRRRRGRTTARSTRG